MYGYDAICERIEVLVKIIKWRISIRKQRKLTRHVILYS